MPNIRLGRVNWLSIRKISLSRPQWLRIRICGRAALEFEGKFGRTRVRWLARFHSEKFSEANMKTREISCFQSGPKAPLRICNRISSNR